MSKLSAAVAGLVIVFAVSMSSTAVGQQTTQVQSQAVPCETERRSAQDEPGRRDTNVTVTDDDSDQDNSWMTQQQVARIVLYDPANLRGRRVGVTEDTPDLASREFSGIASSIRVYYGTWQLCSEANYGGTCKCYASHTNMNRFGMGNPVSDINLEAEGFGDRVASVRRVQRTRR